MKSGFGSIFLAFLLVAVAGRAQTTLFTYQGQLSSSNAPANGLYDFQFQLLATNNVLAGGPLTNAPIAVTNGFFTTTLDFGATPFNGANLWLQVGVRNYGNTNAYTTLSPLQPITSVPYAIRSITANSATNAMFLTVPLQTTNLSGIIAISNLPPNVAFLNSNETFTAAINFANTGNTFTGNGSGLSGLNATALVGTLPDARLSTNVALQSDTALNFAGSVAATNFIGAGHGLTNVPGAFFWVTVSGSSAPANPNVGYICTNNTTPVTITLPASPSVGDTYKVAGVGAAGWILAQNTNQNIFAGNLSSSVGQSWNGSGPGTANWTCIACSADGTKMAAGYNLATSGGYLFFSTNSGAAWNDWSESSGAAFWSGIASSADGTHLIACAGYSPYDSQSGYVYLSANSGVTWTLQTTPGSQAWSSVASSASGNILVVVAHNGYLLVSVNGGGNWSTLTGSQLWTSVACSSSGTNMVAVEGNGYIYTSTNAGSYWQLSTNVSGAAWSSVVSSADGSRLVAASSASGLIYVSTDFGTNWVPENSTVSGNLTGVASSGDGSRLAVTAGGSGATGSIYGSSNSGETWSQLPGAPTLSWSAIASSADGSVLAATAYNGNIYVSSQSSTTVGGSGYLFGAQHSAIDLLYVGNGQFLPLSSEGTIRAY
ncbi:MAG: WD40/YVTN/BNR-like repeat-containing protein [Limisphaerales bacterium]